MPERPTIFIAAAMRSGSTHLKQCFQHLGYRPASTHITLGEHVNEEHMIDARAATLLFPMGGFVFQQHVRAIGRNVPLLKEYGVTPIVTYRNIFDSIVSFAESTDKDMAKGVCQASHSPTHLPDWRGLTREEKHRWIAYNIVPWWISFYVSWRESDIEPILVDYDSFFKDEQAGFSQILDCLNIPANSETVEVATGHKTGKLNVGLSGRGKHLSLTVKHLVLNQADAWGDWAGTLKGTICKMR